jgi:hypothetical protein
MGRFVRLAVRGRLPGSEAHGRNERHRAATRDGATDSSVEQDPEVGRRGAPRVPRCGDGGADGTDRWRDRHVELTTEWPPEQAVVERHPPGHRWTGEGHAHRASTRSAEPWSGERGAVSAGRSHRLDGAEVPRPGVRERSRALDPSASTRRRASGGNPAAFVRAVRRSVRDGGPIRGPGEEMPRATRFALDSVRCCATPRSRSRPTRHSSTHRWRHAKLVRSEAARRPARAGVQATNGRRVTAPVTGCGCRRGKAFEGCCAGGTPALPEASPEATAAQARNPANPRSGTELQQARNRCAEEAVEAVQNREDGTRCRGGPAARSLSPKGGQGGVDAHRHVGGGEPRRQSHGRMDRDLRDPTRRGARRR